MKGKFSLNDVDDVQATLEITMSIRDWKSLKKSLAAKYPDWKVGNMIANVVHQATEAFEAEGDLGE